jgi:hypothetical protein
MLPRSALKIPHSLLLMLWLITGSAQAMWTKAGQVELVESSDVIVRATFIGQASVGLSSLHCVNANDLKGASEVDFGVLNVIEVLKGSNEEIFLLRVPSSKGLLRRSDSIYYQPGQTGLWYLRPDNEYKGLYLADHPNRFVNSENADKAVEKVRKLLKEKN